MIGAFSFCRSRVSLFLFEFESVGAKCVNIAVTPATTRAVVTVEGEPNILITATDGQHHNSTPATETAVVVVAFKVVAVGKVGDGINVVNGALTKVRSTRKYDTVFGGYK